MTVLVCWRCGADLNTITQPFERLAQCRQCGADLHVCRLCKFYNPRLSDKCDHEMAEPAREVDVANFCHYFRPRSGAHNPEEKQRADSAMDQLKSLFGEDTPAETQVDLTATDPVDEKNESDKARFDALFKKD